VLQILPRGLSARCRRLGRMLRLRRRTEGMGLRCSGRRSGRAEATGRGLRRRTVPALLRSRGRRTETTRCGRRRSGRAKASGRRRWTRGRTELRRCGRRTESTLRRTGRRTETTLRRTGRRTETTLRRARRWTESTLRRAESTGTAGRRTETTGRGRRTGRRTKTTGRGRRRTTTHRTEVVSAAQTKLRVVGVLRSAALAGDHGAVPMRPDARVLVKMIAKEITSGGAGASGCCVTSRSHGPRR